MFEFYVQNEYWFAVVQLVLAMLGMGATLRPRDFGELIVKPKAFSLGLVIQLVLVPVITFTCIQWFGLEPAVAIGFALIAAIPGGTLSNIFTYFARGNSALSIAITAVTTLACLLTTPIILGLLIKEYMPVDFQMPAAQIATEIGLFLLLPLILGMLYLRFLNTSAVMFSKWCIRISLFVILLIVIGALGAGRLDMQAFGLHNILLVLALLVAMFIATWVITKLFGLARKDATAIEMEVLVRNVNLGLLIKVSLFPASGADPMGDVVLFTILMYGAFQLLIGGVLIGLGRRRAA
ncbi:bile acid:sodium symporter family protein [Marinicella sp. W31]|uniref:bile acid:sodium symporter family protein n=1 Tax=Marinicella sp. W31 TaxID=3023713 RepID=UPI0037578D58